MATYEKEQEYLAKLMEECLNSENEEDEEFDDEEEEGEDDNLSVSDHNSDTDQDISDTEIDIDEAVELGPHFIGKDKFTRWRKHAPSRNVRTRSENIVTHFPGPKGEMKTLKDALAIWKHFFNNHIIDIIVQNTNKNIMSVQDKYSRERDANQTTNSEIEAVIGLLYFSGVLKSGRLNTKDLWKSDGTGVEIFRMCMSRNRFRFLLCHIRFDDITSREERKAVDKLAAVREVFDIFVDKCKSAYTPYHYVTVDEKLEAFRGRCAFRQYMPNKPNKYGIKIFALCDSKLFYTSTMEVYVGKQPEGPFKVDNSPSAVVERLCQPIKGTGRNVTVDNWFTSISLLQHLKKNYRLTLLGTIRKNKRELPLEFTNPSKRPEKSSMFAFHDDCTLVSYIPRKNKNVLLVSSMHHDDQIDETTNKPEMIMTYNATKSGVDTVDKLCSDYNCARNTRRWTMVIFYAMLNVAGINSFVIHNINNPNKKTLRRDFIRQLSFQLINDNLKYRATLPHLPRSLKERIKEICGMDESPKEAEAKNNTRGRCRFCDRKKNRPTRYFCCKCQDYMCLEHANFLCANCLENVTWNN